MAISQPVGRADGERFRAEIAARLPQVKREASDLLSYSERKAEQFRSDALAPANAGHLRRIAAAGLLRLSGCLKAVIFLTDAGLPLEADAVIRTILELAITACWVGSDETRAQAVWDQSIRDREEGLKRVAIYSTVVHEEIKAAMDELRTTHTGSSRPRLLRRGVLQSTSTTFSTTRFPPRLTATSGLPVS